MAFSRRRFLIGVGGAIVGLPYLEGLAPKSARADVPTVPPFALFHRRANGVQQAMFNQKQNQEPERWWPSAVSLAPFTAGNQYDDLHTGKFAPITQTSMTNALANTASPDCALRALAGSMLGGSASDYTSKLTVIRNLRHTVYGSVGGHREGFVQGLTGAGVQYPTGTCNASTGCEYAAPTDTFNCNPLGESLDNRIARELTNVDSSLYFGLACHALGFVSWQRTNPADPNSSLVSRVGEENLLAMYRRIFMPLAGDQSAQELLMSERKSVNDLVREQLSSLERDTRLSSADRDRLAGHFAAIRDTEVALSCALTVSMADVQAYQSLYDAEPQSSTMGDLMTANAQIVARLAALAISCGVSRSVLISIQEPQDIGYYTQVSGNTAGGLDASITDFHSISHRLINDDPTKAISNATDLHHYIDVFHLNLFKMVLDQLSATTYADGSTLLDKGVCVHYADLGSGQHETWQLPYLYVGSAGGKLATDLYFDANPTNGSGQGYVAQLLNTVGAAVGCMNGAGTGPLDDFNAANSMVTGRMPGLVTG